MIQDLDETLKELLIQKMPRASVDYDIQFDRPNQEWEGKLGLKPTINLFLYDIRENLVLRNNDRYLTRNGATGMETVAPIRMDLTYLVTVWAQKVADEHRLLGEVMKTLLGYPTLPAEVLKGEMANQSLPLRTWVALPDETPKTWDFWGANEWRLKPGINYRVTLAVESSPLEVGLVTEKIIQLQQQ
ncbi:MAG: DUF4255 domain-containing protein [Nostocaceae cyanobacterium]|nr:DUF4255 domain-containing protein [Nostocaceae cyanobacterium]